MQGTPAGGHVLTPKSDLESAVAAGVQSTEPLFGKKEPPAPAPSSKEADANYMKYVSLVLVTLQTTGMVILTRFSRVGERKQYIVSSS